MLENADLENGLPGGGLRTMCMATPSPHVDFGETRSLTMVLEELRKETAPLGIP